MPELPEVETVCRTLSAAVVGRRVTGVRLARADVVRGDASRLNGGRIERVLRRGKQLAWVADPGGAGNSGGCVCVHLGMSGSLRVVRDPRREPPADHVHVVWALDDGTEVRFRDPRRFGGVWAFADEAQLRETRWDKLGPDGLLITPGQLHAGLRRTRRALKAALLDQHLVAGLGNIYVDELLFATRLHPHKLAAAVTKTECQRLVRAMRRLLKRAINVGGSTLRDYVDADGQAGGFQLTHRVYGRGGQPCLHCGRPLSTTMIAGRTTTVCDVCQLGAMDSGER